MISFKIFIRSEIRRFSLDTENLSYEKFLEKLRQNIPSFHVEMKTTYEDVEKDKVIFSSEVEFHEMLSHLKQISKGEPSVIKIWIEESDIPYFKDGSVEMLKMYSTAKDALIEQMKEPHIVQERITNALSRLFPGEVILPYHMPSFLKDVLQVKTTGVADVEIDVPLESLADAINAEAFRLMDSSEPADLEKSRLLLESLQILNPNDPVVYYNLACTESLLNNAQCALERLQTAVKLGYNNVKHMLEDKDLAFLRLQGDFTEFVEKLKSESGWKDVQTNTEEKKEEKKAEDKKEIVEERKENQKEELPNHARWGQQIEMLKGMGFQLEESVFLSVLDHHKGNLDTVVQDLI
jgi:hypothetical protein